MMPGPVGKAHIRSPAPLSLYPNRDFLPSFFRAARRIFPIFLFPAVRYDKGKKLMKEAQSWKFKK